MLVHSGIRPTAYLLCAIVLCTLHGGCAQTNGRHFTAKTLPANLRYPSRTNPQELSLAHLASMPKYGNAIGPGDYLDVSIAAGLDRKQVQTYPVIVSDNGTVKVPELGQVAVAGKKPDTAGAAIADELVQAQLFVNPLVTVEIKKKQTNSVRIVGGVKHPDVYELPTDTSDVLTAITLAGGLSANAGDKVEIRTQNGGGYPAMEYAATDGSGIQQASFSQPMGAASFAAQPMTFSLGALANRGANVNPDRYKLQDGAVVMVQQLDPAPITIRGLVEKPGPLDVTSNDIRILDALGQAGGVSNQFANKIVVIRQTKQGDPIRITVKLTDAKQNADSNLLLAPGDIVSVEQTPATFAMDGLNMIRFGVSSRLFP